MASTNAQNTVNVTPHLVEMTPYQVYLQQVRGMSGGIRAAAAGYSYIAPQFGGLMGQLQTLQEEVVLQLIDFKVGDGT